MIKNTLIKALGEDRGVQSVPLAVERRTDNPSFVTWTGTDVVFGQDIIAEAATTTRSKRFTLLTETMVVKLVGLVNGTAQAVLVRDLGKDEDFLVFAKVRIFATVELVWNYNFRLLLSAVESPVHPRSFLIATYVLPPWADTSLINRKHFVK